MNMNLSSLQLPPNPVIVDCGCNEGQWLSHVTPQLTGRPRVIAIDMLRPEAQLCQLSYPDALVLNAALVDYQTASVDVHRYRCSQCSSLLPGTDKLDQLCGHAHDLVATVIARRHEFSQSSSLLEMTERHNEVWGSPTHQPIAEEQVMAVTLDQIMSLLMIEHVDLLKLDLQGYELRALNGGLRTLSMTDYVISEVEWVELYKGQVLFHELAEFMAQQGFEHVSFFDLRAADGRDVTDDQEGVPACGDALWIRTGTGTV